MRAAGALSVLLAAAPVVEARDASLTQKQRDRVVAQRLTEAGRCLEANRVAVCADPDVLDATVQAGFLALAERGAVAIRRWLGPHLDLPGGNERRVQFVVARDVGIPHVTVWREPWIFMHPETLERDMAPYLHEMVHVMAQWSWRHSEWIAEGFANHAAAAVVEEAAGYHRSFVLPDGLARLDALRGSEAGEAMLPLIGVPGRRHEYTGETAALHARLMADRRSFAPAYYAMSWSFVNYLVEQVGVEGVKRFAGEGPVAPRLLRLREAWLARLALQRS